MRVANSRIAADRQVIGDARRIAGLPEDSNYIPVDPREFCGRIFHTCYMGTENSSKETRQRAKQLAEDIGRCAYPLKARVALDADAAEVTTRT
jgi:NAD+ synthase (glutamine-hydrolysing)